MFSLVKQQEELSALLQKFKKTPKPTKEHGNVFGGQAHISTESFSLSCLNEGLATITIPRNPDRNI